MVFLKANVEAGPQDVIVLDTARTDAFLQIPNAADRQVLGQNDTQREDGDFANLIWRRAPGGGGSLTVALYSHQSRLRYFGSPQDLMGATPDSPLASASEDRDANYVGLRTDEALRVAPRHTVCVGFDVDTLTGAEKFTLQNTDGISPVTTVTDAHALSGGNRAVYAQDDWTPGRVTVNYGARYDIHKADTETSQLSPRLNLTNAASGRDTFHADYDRLFQPAPIEDVRHLDPNAVPFKPERDNFYEVGW